jgi:hypothetical protein
MESQFVIQVAFRGFFEKNRSQPEENVFEHAMASVTLLQENCSVFLVEVQGEGSFEAVPSRSVIRLRA